MSRATKRKHVTKEVIEDLVEPTDAQEIVKVEGGCGNNLHKVRASDGRQFLVSMPRKFRRNVWIKRGDYVVVESIAEGRKVQAEIVNILFPQQVKHLKEENMWPAAFYEPDHTTQCTHSASQSVLDTERGITKSTQETGDSSEEVDSSDDDSDLFVNTNRPPLLNDDDDSDSED